MSVNPEPGQPYFRGDQSSGVTGPNLAKDCTIAEHICRARGKRTQLTCVSLDKRKIRDFGDTLYELLRDAVDDDNHVTIEHEDVVAELNHVIQTEQKAARVQAIAALRRARRRREGLVQWVFDASSVSRKDLMGWANDRVQKYFKKVS